ncbi:MAG: 4-(cytidine 5'-diphospho)-2-C-methyl-D-erythritol kinase [Flavobacteriales bacterium]|nr:4-(cytidine 5'-diphospho)-2-C-methyl-D-erythritol kinase [Flavobacteriales bacterium]
MISFPNAKINLGLNVLRKRPDGYHDIDSVFYPVDWKDVLELVPSTKDASSFHYSGLHIPGESTNNLLVKALALLQQNYSIPAVEVYLHKLIPMGAGLGGGSSDGAFMIKALNELFSLQLSIEEMEKFAAQLGSDCPFFIRNLPAHVEGRGERMSTIELDLSSYSIYLTNPNLHIGTAEAYSGIQPSVPAYSSLQIVQQFPIGEWKNYLKNDFEISAFSRFPDLKSDKEMLYEMGAIYASMTGSGSTLFGIFPHKNPDVSDYFEAKNYSGKWS